MIRWFQRVVLERRWLCFIVLGVSFFAFGAGTLNIIYVLQSNARFLLDNGWQGLLDGGAQQLFELLLSGYASMAAYLVFKSCEHRLVHWINDE